MTVPSGGGSGGRVGRAHAQSQPAVGAAGHPGPVGPARLTQLVGLGRAKDLVYTGRPVDADRALALGLVGEVVPAAEAEAAAVTLAERLVRQSPEGLRQLKAMFRDLEGTEARIAHENELLMDFQRHGAGLPQG